MPGAAIALYFAVGDPPRPGAGTGLTLLSGMAATASLRRGPERGGVGAASVGRVAGLDQPPAARRSPLPSSARPAAGARPGAGPGPGSSAANRRGPHATGNLTRSSRVAQPMRRPCIRPPGRVKIVVKLGKL